MGTSSSSSGPKSGVSFDPPWLDTVASGLGNPLEKINGDQNTQKPQIELVNPPVIAPPGRFGSARRYLGEYIKTGEKSSLKKALGSYSRKGMGGASKLAGRMKASTSAGAGLFNFLQEIRDNTGTKIRDWVNQLSEKNLSAYELADEIINQIVSTGGSPEEESCKDSMNQAISELLSIYPDIDLLAMDNDSIWTVMELFIANEAFNRLNFDIGQLFESAKFSPFEAVSRMNEMKDYLKSEISAQIQELRTDISNPSKEEINKLLQSALTRTFKIFEE